MRFLHYAAAVFVVLAATLLPVPRMASAEEPAITADAAILIETETGRVIWEKNAEERRFPASMTKMMTCILALENVSPRAEIFITPNAEQTEDTPLGILAGERLTADALLTGMMLCSDNGAAVAVAEHIDGGVTSFAKRMNEKAAELGMKDTHFANPNGLPNPMHYSTAHDMARLARYAMRNKAFRSIVGQQNAGIRWTFPKDKFLPVENTNKLLGHYDGITGIKTGWTNAAGGCLAASAERKGVSLIAIVMHAPTPNDRFDDARKMLDYGFRHVTMVRGITSSRTARMVWVKGGQEARTFVRPVEDINYPIIDGEDAKNYTIHCDVPSVIAAPAKDGEIVGKMTLLYKGEPVGTVNMAADKVLPGFSIGSFFVGLFEGVINRI